MPLNYPKQGNKWELEVRSHHSQPRENPRSVQNETQKKNSSDHYRLKLSASVVITKELMLLSEEYQHTLRSWMYQCPCIPCTQHRKHRLAFVQKTRQHGARSAASPAPRAKVDEEAT
jgi:hypothetical protein